MQKNKKLISFLYSLIILPIATSSISVGNMPNIGHDTNSAISSTLVLLSRDSKDPEQAIYQERAEAIDAYFDSRDMPLAGLGMKMVLEAEKNDLDWRLVPAISVRESTGGKHDCMKVENNPFGWGSCKVGFKSNEEAIEIIARNLGGNNPKTARHYDNKTTIQILHAYNPPSIVPRYASQVLAIMKAIGVEDLGEKDLNA